MAETIATEMNRVDATCSSIKSVLMSFNCLNNQRIIKKNSLSRLPDLFLEIRVLLSSRISIMSAPGSCPQGWFGVGPNGKGIKGACFRIHPPTRFIVIATAVKSNSHPGDFRVSPPFVV
jgi:hypothetical protein